MPSRSNNKTCLLDAESVEAEIIDQEYSVQPSAPPPSYEVATGSLSNPYQSVSGQNLALNHAPVSSQPPLTQYQGFTNIPPTGGQYFVPVDASNVPNGQPVFVVPVAVQPGSIGQPVIVHQYVNHQNLTENDSDEDTCKNCCYACLCVVESLRCCLLCCEIMAACK